MRQKDCPIDRAMEVVSGKWTLEILHQLVQGTRRFGELRKALPGISQKTLTERLRLLEEQHIVVRCIYPEIPPRVEYSLTEHGRALGKIIGAMLEWGTEQIRLEQELAPSIAV